MISGLKWVSELIEAAGGRDVFADLRDRKSARERVVDSAEVVRRDPQVIVASWCGKPADLAAIAARPGWERISAVRGGRIHEMDGADILSPGPSLLIGLRRLHELVQDALDARD
jgi:iron complex transport system substrate-binding protein